MGHGKMERLLRLLMLLSGNRYYTRLELAERASISERTIYRYFDSIETAGFILECKEGAYNLKTNHSTTISLQKLFHFSDEEAFMLSKTVSLLEGESPVKGRLTRKLNSLYDFRALTQLKSVNIHEQVHLLSEAIHKKQQVCLINYRSSNSENIGDRKVEPFDFLTDYTAVWCYDTASRSSKQFKISRIQKVQLSENKWQFTEKHQLPFTDAFRMSASKPLTEVEALLTLKACNLLTEEFPLAEIYIQEEDNRYKLCVPIANFHGIGRFVLGLPGQVKVLAPKVFKDFLQNEIKKMEC
ncbi:MAG: helix-turn-helix transcriptional regulator [Sphingobacteriaceae bacterium]